MFYDPLYGLSWVTISKALEKMCFLLLLDILSVSKCHLVLIDWWREMFNWIPGGKSPWFAALDEFCGNILPFPNGSVVSRRCRFDPWVWKILLKKEVANHLSILAWEISWTEEPGGLQSLGLQKSQTCLRDSTTTIAALDDFCRNILPLCPNLSYRCVFEHGIGRKCTQITFTNQGKLAKVPWWHCSNLLYFTDFAFGLTVLSIIDRWVLKSLKIIVCFFIPL